MSIDIRLKFKDGVTAKYKDFEWNSKDLITQRGLRKFPSHDTWYEDDGGLGYSPNILQDYAEFVANIVNAEIIFVRAMGKTIAERLY